MLYCVCHAGTWGRCAKFWVGVLNSGSSYDSRTPRFLSPYIPINVDTSHRVVQKRWQNRPQKLQAYITTPNNSDNI